LVYAVRWYRISMYYCVRLPQVQAALDVCSDYIISLLNFANADYLVHNIADTYSLARVTQFYHAKVTI